MKERPRFHCFSISRLQMNEIILASLSARFHGIAMLWSRWSVDRYGERLHVFIIFAVVIIAAVKREAAAAAVKAAVK
jgi:hypothetical protein